MTLSTTTAKLSKQ